MMKCKVVDPSLDGIEISTQLYINNSTLYREKPVQSSLLACIGDLPVLSRICVTGPAPGRLGSVLKDGETRDISQVKPRTD
jgi:hypothetical protein